MAVLRQGSRLMYFITLVAAFLAGYFLHGTTLPAQSQAYIHSLKDSFYREQILDVPGAAVEAASPQAHSTAPDKETPQISSSSSETSSYELNENTSAHDSTAKDQPDEASKVSTNETGYTPYKAFFQIEKDNQLPKFDVNELRAYTPRNYKGPGHEAFATFFLSRNASMHDPYFLGTMQVIYRVLWDRSARSEKHPIVVFVAPFVPKEQRHYFEASGAIVREVVQHPFTPNQDTKGMVPERFQDVFSKLEMWNQTDFTRIVYLDSDAFPLVNLDTLFTNDPVPDQKCKEALLTDSDRKQADEFCDYCFGAVHETNGMMNAGMMVLKPNEAMYSILMREYQDGHNFDNGFVEQALLTYVFRQDGPFPPTMLSESWNGTPKVRDDGAPLWVLHGKIWALFFEVNHWASSIWEDTWNDLIALYEDPAFLRIRAKEQDRMHPEERKTDISKWGLEDPAS